MSALERTAHTLSETILREYDIRGTVGDNLSEADATAIGRAFGSILAQNGGRRAAVGRDGRLSSPNLEWALVDGLTAAGIDVVRVGLGPTPMLYFAGATLGVDGAVMVTGSHNPPDQNGFKMMLDGGPFFGADIRRLGQVAAEGAWARPEKPGQVSEVEDFAAAYIERLLKDFKAPQSTLTVVWDAGNGAAGEVMRRLCAQLPGRHVLLNEVIDGTFPSHHPDPTVPDNLVQLIDRVAEEGADLGIAFDGDGDRIGVVDGKGRILWGDQLMMVLSRAVLADNPGATVIADVKASQTLFDEIARLGGAPLMWKTGHSLIKTKMKETGAPLAGEMSGHIFFADRYYGFDDALYAAVRLLDYLERSGTSITALRDELPEMVSTPEIRIPCDEARKFQVVEEVASRLEAAGADVDRTDGVRVREGGGWWLLRASNTQAVLVARCEAEDSAGVEALKQAVAAMLTASGVEAPDALR